ncbi:cell division protein FtsZ [Caenibius tardaugens NBRC 16725]|uniref:Cell division protein FtsZ n=1 Tax=Caenibius tardaugens NBRC 16725 TaxID=1219035 RepID=U2Y8D1_9SPHN|nr:cell division protein FtsZ [Caenibius tardaugens]AZI36805.1 cell division protein FtsZ [Caenibius tardaugens NBRC 16725]GAD49486.1 cell division protein FtsZ [Caenibius tardaugens NBRC 16725]
MSINIGPPSVDELRPRITVIGVGGAGGNAIANMIQAQIEGVDFIVANTDAQALNNSIADTRIQLGPDITQGLGAGSRPEVGRAAAEETVEELERSLDGVNMCFIAAGMGGGTGTGAAPVIAEVARRKGVLTVGVVTKPFLFEGARRMRSAEAGIEELQKHVDTLIVIPNQNLFLVAKAETTFKEAFQLADEVLQQGVRSITDLMVMPGLINLDFADVRSVMSEMGKAMMGTGEGEGPNRALEAAERAIANPLLDGVSMTGAKGVIISIIGGDDMKLLEVDEAANHIRELVDADANIIWGSAFNPDLEGKVRVSVVATGIDQDAIPQHAEPRPLNLGAGRAPKRPVLPLPSEAELAQDVPAAAVSETPAAAPVVPQAFEPFSPQVNASAPPQEPAYQAPSEPSFGGYTGAEAEPAAPQGGAEEPFELTFALDESQPETAAPAAEPVEQANGAADDGLLRDADRLAAEDAPVSPGVTGRRRGILGGGAGGGSPASSGGGSTLFERMANLSRSARNEDDDDDDGGSALNIPRFLGRQNNQ